MVYTPQILKYIADDLFILSGPRKVNKILEKYKQGGIDSIARTNSAPAPRSATQCNPIPFFLISS